MGEAQAKLDLTMSIFLFIGVGALAMMQNKVRSYELNFVFAMFSRAK